MLFYALKQEDFDKPLPRYYDLMPKELNTYNEHKNKSDEHIRIVIEGMVYYYLTKSERSKTQDVVVEVDEICDQLTDCETIYMVQDNVWGQQPVDKYGLLPEPLIDESGNREQPSSCCANSTMLSKHIDYGGAIQKINCQRPVAFLL